jgi:general L-amino acid transport system permease protein
MTVEMIPDRAPPKQTGPMLWLSENIYKSPLHAVISIIVLFFMAYVGYRTLNWAIFSATWSGTDREVCVTDGACWPFVIARFNQFMYGFYPVELQWRVNLVGGTIAAGFAYLLIGGLPFKKYVVIFLSLPFPIIAALLMNGGFGLEHVSTSQWGGLTLTLTIAITAIALSLPFGIMLALARRSKMPIISIMAISFIELMRAVPLISVLFMASVLLPIFMPTDVTVDKLLRALIGVTLFASAYMAEVVRGGLQAVPEGQTEAAHSLGLSGWKVQYFIVLPQALKLSIPGIVNTFIGIFKDTSLVIIIGLFDLLGMINAAVNDTRWIGMELEGYVFAATIYWVFCSTMSRLSLDLEKKTNYGH